MSSHRFCDILCSPNALFQGNSLKSQNGTYTLIIQEDGNLVLYEKGNQAVWSSNTYRVGTPPYKLKMQQDGNCVLYDATNKPTWSTNTWKQDVRGRFNLVLQNDREIVVKDENGTVTWSSGTRCTGESIKVEPNVLESPHSLKEGCEIKSLNGLYSLTLQEDGNLVLYQKGQSIWSSNTSRIGKGPYEFRMQQDGNAVIYDGTGNAIWASNTWRPATNKSYKLSLLDSRGLNITDSSGKLLWTANTESIKKIGMVQAKVPEKVKETVEESGDHFTDATFPASEKSLGKKNMEGITWKRANEILGDDWEMFCDGISINDIEQGGLGDCWFLSAIAGVSVRPEMIENLFETKKRNNEGKYIIRLCVGGSWTSVVIDDYFPVKHGKPAFTHNNSAELWVMALEKAYAKVCGSYGKLIAGDSCEAFQVLTGCPTYRVLLESEDSTKLWKRMVKDLNSGYIACTGTKSDVAIEKTGLTSSHAYSLLGCKEGEGVKLVKLRNPWARGEWNGSWSDNDSKWTSSLRKLFGKQDCADDGEFFMAYEDYLKYFSDASFCYCNNDLKRSEVLFPGPAKSETLVDTATYSYIKIDLKHDQDDAYFCIHQKNQRQDGKTEKISGTGFVIIQESTMKVVGGIPVDTKLESTPSLTLKAGVYFLVPIIHSRSDIAIFPISYHIKGISKNEIIKNSSVKINGAKMSLLDLYAMGIKECGTFGSYSGNWGLSYACLGKDRPVKAVPDIKSKNILWVYKPAEVFVEKDSIKCTAIGYKDAQNHGTSCGYSMKLTAYKSKKEKRSRTAEQDDDLEKEAHREPQEMTLIEHLSNLYNSCNSEAKDQNILVPANVIVKTSFKEFNVHDFTVKRSGLFRTMIDSNEQWKLGKIDGKFNIDLSSVENSILPEGEEPLKEEDFDHIFNYLYSDEFQSSYMNLTSLIRIYSIAKYLDIPSLINKMLEDRSFNYFQIKYLFKGELTEDDIVELVFILSERYGNYKFHMYSDELVNYICKQRLVPLSEKFQLLNKKLSHDNDKISKEMLNPYLESIDIMREESKFSSIDKKNNLELFELLKLEEPKEGEALWRHKDYRCALVADICMGACEDSYEEFNLGNQVQVEVVCKENSSAYWWDLKFITDFEDNRKEDREDDDNNAEDEFQLKNRTFYKVHVGSEHEPTREIDIFGGTETIYAPQFDTGGFSAKFLLYFERN